MFCRAGYTPPAVRLLLPLLVLSLLSAPAWAAQPVDRFAKQLDAGRYDDVAAAARRWLEKNGDSALAPEVSAQLAEAAYQLLLKGPTLPRVKKYREEFSESPRAPDLDALESNLSLYDAAAKGTVEAYQAVVEAWPGTAAATEAIQRAEGIAFEAARTDGSATALARFLGDYRDMAHAVEALDLWRVVAWTEAEAAQTSRAWGDLRRADPEHPRHDEAFLIESELALAELSPDASAKSRFRVARRYEGSPAGWAALGDSLDRSSLGAEGLDGAVAFDGLLGAEDPIALPAVAALMLSPPGLLPASVSLTLRVEASPDGEVWEEWRRASFRQAARWGVQSDPTGEDPEDEPGLLALRPPPCRGDMLDRARLRVVLRQGERERIWTRPITLEATCAGPLPVAVQRSAGRVVALGALTAEGKPARLPALPTALLGAPLDCSGPVAARADGLWLGCGALLVQVHGAGLLVRSGTLPASLESDHSPWLDSLGGAGWLAVDVPDAWHFGGRPACPVERGAATPTRPDFIDPALEPQVGDVDGDGVDDLLFTVGADVALASSRLGGAAWVSKRPAEGAAVSLDGCAIGWVGP